MSQYNCILEREWQSIVSRAAPLTGIWGLWWDKQCKTGPSHTASVHFRHPASELGLGVSACHKASGAILVHMCAQTHLMKIPVAETFIWTFHTRESEFQSHCGLKNLAACHSCRNCFHNSVLPPAKSCKGGNSKARPLCQKALWEDFYTNLIQKHRHWRESCKR